MGPDAESFGAQSASKDKAVLTDYRSISREIEMQNSVADVMMKEGSATITIIIHACEEGGFTAECLEIPGCFSEGETQEEAVKNIQNAANECLSVLFEDCLNRLRSNVDYGCLDLQHVSKQERYTVQTPHLIPAHC